MSAFRIVHSIRYSAIALKELIVDLKDPACFQEVQVESFKLFTLEQAAMRRKVEEAPLYLLNGVITMLFSTLELANSCGQGMKI